MNRKASSITVVMPVYNVAPYVERCVLSVMRQTYPATECIIVDDCSTDDSVICCQKLIDEYSGPTRFIIMHHKYNRGLSASRNTGTDAATSEYIYYLDSDDEITEDCLEKLVSPVLRDDTIEMVLGNYRMDYSAMSGAKFQLADCRTHFMEDTPQELCSNEELRRWFYYGKVRRTDTVWNKLLNLSFIKDNMLYNKEGLRIAEDGLWSYYLMRYLKHAAFVHDVTYVHYFRPGSIVMGAKYQDKLKHLGVLYREIAYNIVFGERIEETEHWINSFCENYIDASNNPDYQYAYDMFSRQLSDGRHRKGVNQLAVVKFLSKFTFGRWVYKKLKRVKHLIKKNIGLIFRLI